MSAKPVSFGQLRQSLAGKWQVPLLVCALLLMFVGLLAHKPEVQRESFDSQVDRIVAYQKGRFFSKAEDLIGTLLVEEGRTEDEIGQLHRLMARTLYGIEQPLTRHAPENVASLLSSHAAATEAGLAPTAADVAQVGQAYVWRGEHARAVATYRHALELGPVDPIAVRRRIVELQALIAEAPPEQLEADIEAMLAEAEQDPANLLWAVRQKVELLLGRGDTEGASAALAQVRPVLADTTYVLDLEYLDALTALSAGEHDDAERKVRELRDRLDPASELNASAGWLLGRLEYMQDRPAYALSAFDDVLRRFVVGPYVSACQLGRAEALAGLERYDEAADAYSEVVDLVQSGRQGRLIDAEAVAASLYSLYGALRNAGRLDEALRFIKQAVTLVEQRQDADRLVLFLGLTAGLHEDLGEQVSAQARQLHEDTDGDERAALTAVSRQHYISAAEIMTLLSRANVADEPAAADAAWWAAVDYDLAGQTEKVIEALSAFVQGRPRHSRTPEAMYRLGIALQAQGRATDAVEVFRTLLRKHPRTLSAFDSYVPLSQCFLALGPDHYQQAEQVLLIALQEDPSESGYITTQAPQFREALFHLAQLYDRGGEYAKAIARLEDFLAYYPENSRETRVKFMLAEAYRKAGAEVLAQADTDTSTRARSALELEFLQRTRRAVGLYGAVIGALEAVDSADLSPVNRYYQQLAYLYRGDCQFDLGRYDPDALSAAIDSYEEAAYRYQGNAAALSAYVQLVNCHVRQGDVAEARSVLGRAQWLARKMPPGQFGAGPLEKDQQRWQEVLSWLGDTGLLAE